ncbi:inositol polyphosphate 5-phosphatase K [Ictalurus punctatus]|uniref:Phosphatidylinositol 4,5-bisphosphate 5-phosphatase A n=1 Tax=Ictalurus punctatus TaxID=7998 RepID=A0A9F7RLV9_ICTPU|nr:inositol polyphosphate 5-phosphatase K [Ictalurus punctatus]XP_053542738.1 inositol polyphosphate 5-phosphatase K [Ictalurus punctatus]XP_053542739.1 inositol polyphosphate 5-phosphatase K [Ictalurus punctatus]
MDPAQPGQSCSFLMQSTGAPRLSPSSVPILPPPASVLNPPALSTAKTSDTSLQERGGPASTSLVSGSVSISRPRPSAKSGVKSPRTVDPPAILPIIPATRSTSQSPTESLQGRRSPQSLQNSQLSPKDAQLSPNAPLSPIHTQRSPSTKPNSLNFPSPSVQPGRSANTHSSLLPKPNLNAQSIPIPQTNLQSQTPEPIIISPGTAEKAPHKRPYNDDGDFRVHIVTWNVGSAMPPDDISSLFSPGVSDGSTDMFIIGLQEVNSMINKRLKDALFVDQWSELCMDTLGRSGYVLVASQRMQGVLLLVFSKFCHLPFLRGIQTQSTRTGLGGCWGNKGGVSVRMMMYGHPVCFLNCHLPAHMRNLEQRIEDFESILQQQQFEGGAAVGVLDHDVVFWFGDLNFRIDDYDIHVVKSAIENNKLYVLWEKDQLNIAKKSESVMDDFVEGPLNFPPTYKFDVGTHTYDTSTKKRKPAWTDRILWRLRRTGSPVPSHNSALQRGLTSWLGGATRVTQSFYRSHMGYTVSDHKPVSALFSLHFPFKLDIPLVELEVEKEWTKVSDATAKFTIASGFQRSSWDWVGLYKVGFKHHKDYAAYVWAKSDHSTQVTFPEEDLPRDAGEYVLGYYGHNMNSIVGITEPFQVQLPVCSPPARPCPSHSDSSDASSEDDSTLVLLASSSRSPSPRTRSNKRQQHSHHRSHSPAVPALQSLSLKPRDSSVSPRQAPNTKKERLFSPESPSPSLSPLSPANGITVPEALVAAILGEHRPPQGQIPAKSGDSNR